MSKFPTEDVMAIQMQLDVEKEFQKKLLSTNPEKSKMSLEFEAAVRRAKRKGKFKPVHYRGVRD